MEQLNSRERAYLQGFRDDYRRAMSELRGLNDEERARLQDWTARLETKCDRVDAIAAFDMKELRRKAREMGYEIAREITNKMWAGLNTELADLRAEVIRLRAGDSGGPVDTERDPETQFK